MPRSWYKNAVTDFLSEPDDSIIGKLAAGSARDGFDADTSQIGSWQEEITVLKSQLELVDFSSMDIFLEFNIPRMGRRIDALLLIHSDKPHILILEFKVGKAAVYFSDIDQVTDYALELKNFHEGSHGAVIFPILVPTEMKSEPALEKIHEINDLVYEKREGFDADMNGIADPVACSARDIGTVVNEVSFSLGIVTADEWESSPYKPTPTIIEAALALYANHDVSDITRSEGSAANIKSTADKLIELMTYARKEHRKIIAFVTGVPGAGKTLVGLKVATLKRDISDETHAVFLSGNGPLVQVLQEALTRDECSKNNVTKSQAKTKVKAFIQNVHHYRDEGIRDPSPPDEHVAIFDEAQRAWNEAKTTDFMKRRKGILDFGKSEPEFLISCLDRHKDWAVVVCLVGGGQEINRGEAGIGAWIEAIIKDFPDWDIAISDRMTDSEYAAGQAVRMAVDRGRETAVAGFTAGGADACAVPGMTKIFPELHLSVSMRSFRSENVSEFVKALLDIDKEKARTELAKLAGNYPIRITRDLAVAKKWIRAHARGTERPGLLASSKALRLKPFAIDSRVSVDPVHYFLNGKDDTRSSYYLEDAASEFVVQGLELDYTLVSWDGDLRMLPGESNSAAASSRMGQSDSAAASSSGQISGQADCSRISDDATAFCKWSYHDFKGSKWQNIHNEDNRYYLKNAYRVLLTRARQGMVIFVPLGNNPPDATRDSSYYDGTYQYLKSLGIEELTADIEDRGY